MRIATWNVERLKHIRQTDQLLSVCQQLRAQILVLTETDQRLQPAFKNCVSTASLEGVTTPVRYAGTERRVSIYSDYDLVQLHKTYDDMTAVCAELRTEMGNLLVYGTVVGVLGNRDASYGAEMAKQMEDIRRLMGEGHSVCMIGDFNCSFGDNYYFTNEGRDSFLQGFSDNRMTILTADKTECVDHIAISDDWLKGIGKIEICEWNQDKRLSDHKGIAVDLRPAED